MSPSLERENLILSRVRKRGYGEQRERERERMEDRPEEEEEVLGSSLTMEKVAAAKQFIENHYRAQRKNIQERKERYTQLNCLNNAV